MNITNKEVMSQSPQTGQFNSYGNWDDLRFGCVIRSQSPQTGQFNSYMYTYLKDLIHENLNVSIPSNGSIQFLL